RHFAVRPGSILRFRKLVMKRGRRLVYPIAIALAVAACLGGWLFLHWLEQSYSPGNYTQIEEGLFVGGGNTTPPPGTREILNVCETRDSYSCEVHVWEPIRDAAPAPSLDWLRKQVDFVAAQREAGLPVYVHCHAGHSRSVMVITAYLMKKHQW